MTEEVKNVLCSHSSSGSSCWNSKGMGFCLFNNVAIGAKYLRKKYGTNRILILDWDVPRMGTEQEKVLSVRILTCFLFLFIRRILFRKTVEELRIQVEGEGEGFNVNIELPAGTGNEGYRYTFEHVVEPIIDQFQPEFIFISAGQDPSRFDPLGRMLVTASGFYIWR